MSVGEIDVNDKCCEDDIIGQSLMLACNSVDASPEQPPISHDPCHQSQDEWLPLGNHRARSCDQHESHDQYGSHDQQISESHNANKPRPGAVNSTTKTTVTTNKIPSKITFIDWTEIKRKHVTPSDYPSTPTPINVKLDQDVSITAVESKKKKTTTNPTVSMHDNYVYDNYCMVIILFIGRVLESTKSSDF